MAPVVKLSDIIDALDSPGEWELYLDPSTGEIIPVTEDDRFYLDDDEEPDLSRLPEWQRDSLARARRALDSPDMLQLPDRFEIHEWDIMRRFSASQEAAPSGELMHAIHGSGAFRMFRATVDRLGLRDTWFEFRADAFRRIAIDWLESSGIEYVDDRGGASTAG
jgi:hypothetical protein